MTDYTQIEFAIPAKASIVEIVVGEAFAGVFTYFLCEGMKVILDYVTVQDISSVNVLYACAIKALGDGLWQMYEMRPHEVKERGMIYSYRRLAEKVPALRIESDVTSASLQIRSDAAHFTAGCTTFQVSRPELIDDFVKAVKVVLDDSNLGKWELARSGDYGWAKWYEYKRVVAPVQTCALPPRKSVRKWTKEELDEAEDIGLGHHDMDGFVWYGDARPVRHS